MKRLFIAVCILATVCDVVATMFGLCVAARIKTVPAYLFGSVSALIVVALVLSTRDIWRRQDMTYRCMRPFWALALVANVVAVFCATANHVILEQPIMNSGGFEIGQVYSSQIDAIQLATIAVLVLFLTAAPVAVSFLWRRFLEEEDFEEAPDDAVRTEQEKAGT